MTICFLLSFLGLLLLFYFFFNLGKWLAVFDHPENVDIIIALSNAQRVSRASEFYHADYAPIIYITSKSYLALLIKKGVPDTRIHFPEKYPQTTYQEALDAYSFYKKNPFQSAMVISSPYHLYRVRWSFRHVFQDENIDFLFSSSKKNAVNKFWWKDVNDRCFVLKELPKIIYYWVYHGILGRKSDPGFTPRLKQFYNQLLDWIF